MMRPRQTARPAPRKSLLRRLEMETLERRLLLHGGADELTALLVVDGHPAGCFCPACGNGPLPATVEFAPTTGGSAGGTAAGSPLNSVPALNSLPGARATLFLDFDGHFESHWGAYRNISTPAFDQDGDPTAFSDGELAAIEQIWRSVAEDYAPFNINVTTVPPPSFANGAALRVAVGGNGSWADGSYGGISYVNSFTNSVPNTAYVFARNLSNGNDRYVADAVSHEAGHAFGLQHQSEYVGTTRVAEYADGTGDGRAPLMGSSYRAPRGTWWYGATSSSTTFQDDMAVIARTANGFGYRADEAGNRPGAAAALAVNGSQVSAAGVIASTADADYFSFRTSAGLVSLSVAVALGVNNLDARLELRDGTGAVVASADPGVSFGADLSVNVLAGKYFVVVASHGSYGDVGQYTLSGSIVPPEDGAAPAGLLAAAVSAAPAGLRAVAASGRLVDLTWQDNADNETGYVVQRSTNGGRKWKTIARLGADADSYSDLTVKKKRTYSYRVHASGPAGNLGTSNVATITTPDSARRAASRAARGQASDADAGSATDLGLLHWLRHHANRDG